MSLPDEVIHHIVDNVCGRILISCDRGVSVSQPPLYGSQSLRRRDVVGNRENDSVPKIPTNDTMNAFFRTAISVLLVSNRNSFRVPCSIESLPYTLSEKCIYMISVEMSSAWFNRHCASCIGTLSFHISRSRTSLRDRQTDRQTSE